MLLAIHLCPNLNVAGACAASVVAASPAAVEDRPRVRHFAPPTAWVALWRDGVLSDDELARIIGSGL